MLRKKPRPIHAYTPVGAVVHAVRNRGKEVTETTNLANVTVEGEILDSVSLEQLAAAVYGRGSLSSTGDTPSTASWEEVNALFTIVGKRVRCRLDNAPRPDAQRQECESIGVNADALPTRDR
jgi:hypothetical protein